MFQALRGRWDAVGMYKGAPVYRHECPVVWCRHGVVLMCLQHAFLVCDRFPAPPSDTGTRTTSTTSRFNPTRTGTSPMASSSGTALQGSGGGEWEGGIQRCDLATAGGRKAKGEARVSAVLLRCSGRHAGAILYELKLDRRSSSSPIIAPQPPAGCQVRTSSAPTRARPPTREQLGVDKQLACPSRSQVHARRPFPRL